jgi:uncharacterized damage-inducible protein DinB
VAEQQISLLPFYKGWDSYQELLIKAIEPLSLDQLSLRTAPQLRSIGENAAHIIGARAGWLHYVLKEGGEDLVSLGTWDDPGQPARSAAELMSGLETTWQVIQNALQRWTIADLEEIFHDIDENGEEKALTRQWVIWHLIEHDVHHGGEISFTLGMHGLAAIDL